MPNQGKITTRSRRQRPPKPLPSINNVEFHSILRIRPLLKKEKDDSIILEPAKKQQKDVQVAVLSPIPYLSSPDPSIRKSGNLSSPKFIQTGRQEEFHFDTIYSSNDTQDSIYYSTGLVMATNAMEPLKRNSTLTNIQHHLAITMGVANSGKTHTTFGDLRELARPVGRSDDDGLVPRILESLFSQSKHHVSSKKQFAVKLTLLHVENEKVYDLLADESASSSKTLATPPSSTKKKKSGVMAMVASLEGGNNNITEIDIEQDPATHDYNANASVKTCWSISEAREALQEGLNRGLSSKLGGLTRGHSRGHTLITMQPVIIRGSKRDSTAVDKSGGTITFLDMAGMEKSATKKTRGAVRDAIANNSCFAAVQHVLRTIKHNQDVASGKVSSEIDVSGSDDADTFDGSELSNVSEPKSQKATTPTIKPVPYRQSKVTMLLQPLFSNAAQWNLGDKKTTTVITTLLTASPGHRDYTEKRSLLNDMELLLGSDIAKRRKHAVSTGVDSGTPKQIHGSSATTLEETSEETSSLEMSSSDDDSSPPTETVSYKEQVPVPMPPPYAPGSHMSVDATAPPIDQVYSNVETPIASTPVASAPASSAPPSSASSRRTQVVDLPGVTLPTRLSSSSTPYAPASTGKRHRATPTGIAAETHVAYSKPLPSPRYTSPPLSTSQHNKPSLSSAAKASIAASPNIQPPLSNNATTMHRHDSPPSSATRNWKSTSPMKTISRAVYSSKKHGKRAIDKVDKIMDRTVAKRMSNEFESKPDASNEALQHRVKVLEKQNAKLASKNQELVERCEQLETENEQLKRAAQSSKMQWRKDCWTVQDEQEWQRSKRMRLEEQDLIRSPLREHLENVQESYENSNQWMRPTQPPFSLQFPSHFQRAAELDQRDRALEEQQARASAPSRTTPHVGVARAKRSSTGSKRKSTPQLKALKKLANSGSKRRHSRHHYD